MSTVQCIQYSKQLRYLSSSLCKAFWFAEESEGSSSRLLSDESSSLSRLPRRFSLDCSPRRCFSTTCFLSPSGDAKCSSFASNGINSSSISSPSTDSIGCSGMCVTGRLGGVRSFGSDSSPSGSGGAERESSGTESSCVSCCKSSSSSSIEPCSASS